MNLKRLGLLLDPQKGLCRLEDHPHYLTAGPDLLSRQEDDLKKKFGLIDLNVDITTMNLRTLRRYFGHKTEETIDGALFIRNVIWQLYRFTKAGKPPPIIENGGNLRSIWYHVKKLVRAQSKAFQVKGDMADTISEEFKAMVIAGLLSYVDLNLMDDRLPYRRLAPKYGNRRVILLAEKVGFFSKMVALGVRYGATVQITRGEPSLNTMDHMLTEMAEAGYDLTQKFILFDFCDFDPVGWNIGEVFVEHMRIFGINNITRFRQYRQQRYCLDLVNPHELDSKFLDEVRHRLKRRKAGIDFTSEAPSYLVKSGEPEKAPLINRWLACTGGLYGRNGKTWGVSAEEFLPLLDEHADAKIIPRLETPPEAFYRLSAIQGLNEALRPYLVQRLIDKAEQSI